MRHMEYSWPPILQSPGTVVIDDRDPERATRRTLLFSDPEGVIVARGSEEVAGALERIDAALAAGKHLAGYLAYDAGISLDKPIQSRHAPTVPVIWLGVYSGFAEVDLGELERDSAVDIGKVRLNVAEEEYLACVDRIRDYIAAGDVYQVNYTVKLLFEHTKPAWQLFARLRRAHPVGYSAFIDTGEAQAVSISPELFLRREGDAILTRPMKGTARRGRWYEEDVEAAEQLAADSKNRAENIMIVDLMRNDIGRVCEMGGVSVPRVFHIERYPSLFQMTSDVHGRLREGVAASELLRAVFPPGSITGAPKIRAMEIIDQLEHESRGVYCGCIGYLGPSDWLLNVAIRTVVQRGEHCEMGIGSGIVADSDPASEFAETLLKGRFLDAEAIDFELLETLLYMPESGYHLLAEHIERMRRSAEYFGWGFPEEAVRDALDGVAVEASGTVRVRLLLGRDGSCQCEWAAMDAPPDADVKLLLVEREVDPSDVFLYHKTTRREAYDAELHEARERGFFDALHVNTRGELTEGSITNILLELDGEWFTPPMESGLLPGIWRARVLAEGKARERVLTLDDLRRATRVIAGNSVRGAMRVCSVIRGSETLFHHENTKGGNTKGKG